MADWHADEPFGGRARLRLLADDLPAALDAAARFVAVEGVIPTVWGPPRLLSWPAAVDAGTRDLTEAEAVSLIRVIASVLDNAEPAFKTIDAMGRGHTAVEIGACARLFSHCVIAPACPEQGITTRAGRQSVRDGPTWSAVGADLARALGELGVPVRLCRPGDAAPDGASLWDAEDDAGLAQIVAECRCLSGPVLWCGTSSLAQALAGGFVVPCPPLPRPILGLIGSDHAASIGQLSAAWARVRRIDRGDAEEAARITRLLQRDGAVAVAAVLPPNIQRTEAARRIDLYFAGLLANMERPGTLLVAGGGTLRALCRALGAERLDVDGQAAPGVPSAILRGGGWDGQRVIAKSGGFGDAGLLARLLSPNPWISPADGADASG